MADRQENDKRGPWNVQWIAFLCLVIIGGFFLWSEHRAHVMGALPYLILLLCPLMHFFMHRGHGGHNGKKDDHDYHQGGRA